jgi:hypothetical protein
MFASPRPWELPALRLRDVIAQEARRPEITALLMLKGFSSCETQGLPNPWPGHCG